MFSAAVQADGAVLPAENLAWWVPAAGGGDGAWGAWEAVPGGHGLNVVYSLAEDATGALYAGGSRLVAGQGSEARALVARLDPATGAWSTLREWPFATVRALAVVGDPTAGGALYAGTYSHGVWRWSGGAWTALGGPGFTYSLALNGDPAAEGLLYVGGLNGDTSGPYVRAWDGQAWHGLGSGLAGFFSPPIVYALAVGPAAEAGTAALWVGGEFLGAGGQPASCIARWETADLGTSAEGAPAVPLAAWVEAYPNPSRGAATVRYGIEAPGAVRVSVYDVLGREVAVLHDGPQGAGAHEVALGAGLAPGSYVVRVASGAAVGTTRVVVVR